MAPAHGFAIGRGPSLSSSAPARPASPHVLKMSAMDDPVAKMMGSIFASGTGKKIFFGVFQKDVELSEVPSDEERAELRRQAEADLTNIDAAERERRQLAGTALGAATLVLAIGLLAVHAPAPTRFAIAPPLFLSYGYLSSAREGL